MTTQRFSCLSDADLADVWYALGGADTRHPGTFSELVDAAFSELNARLDTTVAPYLEERFRRHRLVDSKEDAAAARAARDTPSEG